MHGTPEFRCVLSSLSLRFVFLRKLLFKSKDKNAVQDLYETHVVILNDHFNIITFKLDRYSIYIVIKYATND